MCDLIRAISWSMKETIKAGNKNGTSRMFNPHAQGTIDTEVSKLFAKM